MASTTETSKQVLDRILSIEIVRVTERAAVSAARLRGHGNQKEADQAADEGPLAAEEVTELAADEQQAAERKGIRRDDPLAAIGREAEIGLRGGQRDVHDGRVEHHHELGDAEERQHCPPVVLVRGC